MVHKGGHCNAKLLCILSQMSVQTPRRPPRPASGLQVRSGPLKWVGSKTSMASFQRRLIFIAPLFL